MGGLSGLWSGGVFEDEDDYDYVEAEEALHLI
jgi:hypothetical protein